MCDDVRYATVNDQEWLYQLLLEAHRETDGLSSHCVDEEKLRMRIWAAVNRQGSLMGVVGDEGKPLKAVIYICLDEVWYSQDPQLIELINFVHPDHRKSSYAKQLIEFGKKVADGLGIDLVIGVLNGTRTDAKVRLYRRHVQPVGSFFLYHGKKDDKRTGVRD